MQFNFTPKNIYSYEEYMSLTQKLVDQKQTTGPNQTQSLIDFTSLNLHRMKRLNKTLKLSESIKEKLSGRKDFQRWVVISEAWCGDAAQNLPILNMIAASSDNIQLDIILRDENEDIIDAFLTNGVRSIPKLIALDKDNSVLYTWGPRPQRAQDLFIEHKNNPEVQTAEEFKLSLHAWYAKDKSFEVQKEFISLL